MITLIIVLIIITVATVFSVQNAIPVAISFLFWKFESSKKKQNFIDREKALSLLRNY